MKFSDVTWEGGLGFNDLALWIVNPCQMLIEEVNDTVMEEAQFRAVDGPVEIADAVAGKLNLAAMLLDQIREKLSDFDVAWHRERQELKSYKLKWEQHCAHQQAVEEDQQDA